MNEPSGYNIWIPMHRQAHTQTLVPCIHTAGCMTLCNFLRAYMDALQKVPLRVHNAEKLGADGR